MSVVCQGTWLLAQRLAIVSALPEAGAVIRVASTEVRFIYGQLIHAHRGRGLAVATILLLPDDPVPAGGHGLPIFTDAMARSAAPVASSAPLPAAGPAPATTPNETDFMIEAKRQTARARLAARAVERSIAKAALLATIDAIPMSGGIVVATNVRMKDYLHALLRTRRPAYALASVWFLVAGTEELERQHLGDVKLPVIRPPGVALNRTRAAKRAVVALSSNTPGA